MIELEQDSGKSPCCDAALYDLDCEECETEGEDFDGNLCQACDGQGYHSGWRECAECGDSIDENDIVYRDK